MCYERRFTDLRVAMEEVQHHFRGKIEAPGTNGAADAFCRLQLAVHEWITNLERHACFGEKQPDVRVCIQQCGEELCCTVEDNSAGFDLDMQVKEQQSVISSSCNLPEDGMGLLLVMSGTEHAEYVTENGVNVVRLVVRVGAHPEQREAASAFPFNFPQFEERQPASQPSEN